MSPPHGEHHLRLPEGWFAVDEAIVVDAVAVATPDCEVKHPREDGGEPHGHVEAQDLREEDDATATSRDGRVISVNAMATHPSSRSTASVRICMALPVVTAHSVWPSSGW
jgi:hypothetical protein